jgi:hypothetical protein
VQPYRSGLLAVSDDKAFPYSWCSSGPSLWKQPRSYSNSLRILPDRLFVSLVSFSGSFGGSFVVLFDVGSRDGSFARLAARSRRVVISA